MRAKLERRGASIEPNAGLAELKAKGYGLHEEDGKLIASPLEALHLVEQGKLEVVDGRGRRLTFQDLLEYYKSKRADVLTRYLIFKDLRGKAYVIKEVSRGSHFLVYSQAGYQAKAPPCYMVVKVCEGGSVSISDLLGRLEAALRSGQELLLAVVDRRNEAVYYLVEPWPPCH